MTVKVRRDENDYACAIDINGITVLHLNPGTERNELCAEMIAISLNSVEDATLNTIVAAANLVRETQ